MLERDGVFGDMKKNSPRAQENLFRCLSTYQILKTYFVGQFVLINSFDIGSWFGAANEQLRKRRCRRPLLGICL